MNIITQGKIYIENGELIFEGFTIDWQNHAINKYTILKFISDYMNDAIANGVNIMDCNHKNVDLDNSGNEIINHPGVNLMGYRKVIPFKPKN